MSTTESVRRSPSDPADGPPSPAIPPLAAVSPLTLRREPSDRDIRRKRPPALSLLLRLQTVRRLARIALLLALDLLGVALAVYTALLIKGAVLGHVRVHDDYEETRHIVAFAYLVTALLFARSGLYSDRGQRPGVVRIVGSLFQVTVVAAIFAVVQGGHYSSFYIFYASLAFATVYVSSLRYGYERVTGSILRAAGYRRRALLVGTGQHIRDVAHALAAGPVPAVQVVGFISLEPLPDNGLRSLGSLDELEEVLSEHHVDEVIIADPDFPQVEAVELVDRCHQRGVIVHVAPSTMEILIHRAEFVPGQTVPLFELKPPVFEGIDFALKRAFDLVGATLLIVLLSPVWLAITLAVRMSSRGPILFRSIRPGIGGRPFPCLKFRTMQTDAEERQAELEALNEAGGALFKIRRDPRLTPVGAFLRRFSLDELPQLVNVLRGEMSLVGPRPLPQRDYERLEDWHRKRYLVLPGITGLWQVSGRSDLDFDDLVRLDFLYLERWSVALDLAILVKTVPAVLLRRGAY
ncbi:MAG TPA: sugar transferase [Solirubrobacteraceae bacterium]|jgi:exopolysaccharide biosynthesis polyprenyl glycosylphosphotransferase|nr:sugar transferase [Solirubrobacteraceae bacterium]